MIIKTIKKISKEEKIYNILKYSLVKYLVLAIGFINNIVNAKFLGPDQLGLLGGLLLIVSYLGYTDLGILHSMNREFPIAIKSDKYKAKNVLNTTFTFLIYSSILVGVISSIIILYFFKDSKSTLLFVLTIIAAMLQQFSRYYINYFRLVDKVTHINRIEIIKYVLGLIITLILIKLYGVYGVVLSLVICNGLVIIYGLNNSDQINIYLDKLILKNLILVGLPLLIYNLGFYILTSIDRLIIMKYLESSDMGIYTFANQISGATLMFVTSILFLYYPQAIQNLNFNNMDKKSIINYMSRYTKYIELFGVGLISIGIIFIYPFINIVLPSYYDSIYIYIILVVGLILSKITYLSNVCIVSNNHQNKLVILQVISIIVGLILNILFIKIGLGLKGIAIATTLVNIIYSCIQSALAYRLLGHKKSMTQAFKDLHKIIIITLIIICMSLLHIKYYIYASICIVNILIIYKKDISNMYYRKKFK